MFAGSTISGKILVLLSNSNRLGDALANINLDI
jgi:hypothetical protein